MGSVFLEYNGARQVNIKMSSSCYCVSVLVEKVFMGLMMADG
jgi:hypothetical protein